MRGSASRFRARTRAEHGERDDASAGQRAVSVPAPAYGIDLIDRVEALSGVDLSGVRVHSNSSKPAQLGARAYAQGADIYLAPGQERSLPHEAWHVVQQRQGRVQPTLRLNGVAINDSPELEREAHEMGKRANAVASTPRAATKSAAQAPAATGVVVQRDIGFEYETTADTYLAAVALNNAQRRVWNFPLNAQPLRKGNVLVANMGGLHAKADQGGVGLGSNLELETDPFPETGAGRRGLHRALKNLERFCALIDARRAQTPHLRSSHLAWAFGGTAPHSRRYIRANGDITGNPQATAGVRLDKVEELMERTVGGPTIGPNPLGGAPPLARLELGAQNDTDFQTVGNAPTQVRAGIANYMGAYAGGVALPVGLPSDSLVGMCSLLLTYIIGGTVQKKYAKQIAPLMARTDFGTIFTTDLPAGERAFFAANGGAEFTAMFTHLLTQAGVGGGLAAQLFAAEPLAVQALGFNISGSLTRQAWLADISQGNDLLTTATFPNPSAQARAQLQGLGGFGTRQGPDPTGGGVFRPILEMRRMRKQVAPHEFTEMAMGVFDYIVALNSGVVNPVYQPVARPHKDLKKGQRFLYRLAGG